MLNYQLQIEGLGDEFMISIGHDDEFYVNLLLTALFIDRCAHIWVSSPQSSNTIHLFLQLLFHFIIQFLVLALLY